MMQLTFRLVILSILWTGSVPKVYSEDYLSPLEEEVVTGILSDFVKKHPEDHQFGPSEPQTGKDPGKKKVSSHGAGS